ncbi:MAG: metallophosphoesterase [Flavobacteriia bacterium]|nr:metallophosphoesterase [Flavobacteriia bacterium]
MKKRIIRYLVHITSTIIILLLLGLAILLSENGAIHYGDNPLRMNWNNDGPYIFFEGDSILSIQYIHGNREEGFDLTTKKISSNVKFETSCYFNLDGSSFDIVVDTSQIRTPPSSYMDEGSIFAVSDIESGFRTFRDLLINNKIIDHNLHWCFGNGHLVLVGDFVDRGLSTTQVLWFIYKLEQEAKAKGGNVHFIIGNHEIKNMQANFDSSSPKYTIVSYILERGLHELYGRNSFLGRWMASKNSIELINGHLFVHGGIHPDVAGLDLDIDEMNEIIRSRYRLGYFPRREMSDEQILTSTNTGPAWYRGYFKDGDLSQAQVESGLKKFNAIAVVVGHTIQRKVNRIFDGKVIGIDIQHPNDFHKNWPHRESEALLIENNRYYRVLANATKEEL